jgi:hypothetical protein
MMRHRSLGLLAALALGLLALLQGTGARGDGPPPSTEGSILVHVVDPNNKDVAGATVRVVMVGDRTKIVAGGVVVKTGPKGGEVADVQTGSDGMCKITGLPVAGYNVIAKMDKVGHGKVHVEISGGSAGASNVSITITLAAG